MKQALMLYLVASIPNKIYGGYTHLFMRDEHAAKDMLERLKELRFRALPYPADYQIRETEHGRFSAVRYPGVHGGGLTKEEWLAVFDALEHQRKPAKEAEAVTK